MRVLAIGLGGAGSRIVDRIYDHDRRSRVLCTNALVIDYDFNTLTQLESLPEESKEFFPPIDPSSNHDIRTVVDIEEVMTRIQKVDTIEIDAILVIAGLGGTMVDIIPLIVPQLRRSFIEPIFAVVTLPAKKEGLKRAAKAADDLEMIGDLVDGTIIFDNETWMGRIRTRSGNSPAMNPRAMYSMLNEVVARRIGLLLRAGEFNENGLEVGELVLDAGEVLNTLTGAGIVAVGYAAERLPSGPFEFLTRWRDARRYMEGSKERAARIVSLAKKATYEEISVPCDMTSAERALVLIAGPDRELSMRGFVTIRKWIDRSIAGLEVRSGDYPIKSTKFVGIIVVLAGVQNIPRLNELKACKEEYLQELEEAAQDSGGSEGIDFTEDARNDVLAPAGGETEMADEKDDMITIAGRKKKKDQNDGKLQVHLSSDHLKKTGDGESALVVPGAKKQTPRDMTRMTSVGIPQAPKDSSLGIGRHGADLKKPKELDGTDLRVDTLPAAKDDALSGKSVSLKGVVKQSKDDTLSGKTVRVEEAVKKTKDDLLRDDLILTNDTGTRPIDDVLKGVHLASKQKPKEIVPGRGKIKGSETEKEEDDQGGIDWIT